MLFSVAYYHSWIVLFFRLLRTETHRVIVNYSFLNLSATPFMQYRNPVGSGPSSKTWPR